MRRADGSAAVLCDVLNSRAGGFATVLCGVQNSRANRSATVLCDIQNSRAGESATVFMRCTKQPCCLIRIRALELCESGGGRPRLPFPNSPHGLCGRNATLQNICNSFKPPISVAFDIPQVRNSLNQKCFYDAVIITAPAS